MSPQVDIADIYRRYGALIYARCRRLLGDPVRAEDAVQEIFIRAQRHQQRIPEEPDTRKWLYRVTRNYCLNVLRDERGWQQRQSAEVAASQRAADQSPEELLLQKDLVRQLIARLPGKMQAIVMAYYLEDMDQRQVAEALGISRRTVINQLQEFHDKSRKFLARGS